MRRPAVLDALRNGGADAVIDLSGDLAIGAVFDEVFAEGVDVVLGYLLGPSAEAIIGAATRTSDGRVRLVQVGTSSAPSITLPGAVLHSSPIEILGSGSGVRAVLREQIGQVLRELIAVAPSAGSEVPMRRVPLSGVEHAWGVGDRAPRIVFTTHN